jgi:aminoglycoside/choline kinase family phosphotransferase
VLNTQEILDKASVHMPEIGSPTSRVEPIERGGSGRCFFRIHMDPPHDDLTTLILVHYSNDRDENQHFVEIAQFLAGIGIRVPSIYFHDETEDIIAMEDLGEHDLWSHRREPWEKVEALYRKSIDQTVLLHARAHRELETSPLELQKEFDESLYLWEQEYFLNNCVTDFLGRDISALDRAPLEAIARELAALPRTLVHRDLQSRNIMICDGEACLIDFQGLRPGLPHYDLASLLLDPYVRLRPSQRAKLSQYYETKARIAGVPLEGDFAHTLRLCSIQRLMQALGAYGYLGKVKGHTPFFKYIAPAMRRLRAHIEGVAELKSIEALIA